MNLFLFTNVVYKSLDIVVLFGRTMVLFEEPRKHVYKLAFLASASAGLDI